MTQKLLKAVAALFFTLYPLLAGAQQDNCMLLEKVYNAPLTITPATRYCVNIPAGSRFNAAATFSNIVFPADFRSITFSNTCTFKNVRFTLDTFEKTNFNHPKFENSVFDSTIYCQRCTITQGIFKNCFFRSDFILEGGTSSLSFSNCFWSKKLQLYNVQLASLVMQSDTVISSVDLIYSSISNTLKLQDLVLKDSARLLFNESKLPDTIILSNIRTGNEISFSRPTWQNKKHILYLSGVDASKLFFNYDDFQIVFKTPDGSPVPDNEINLVYEGLLKNYKDKGMLEYYKLVDIDYMKFKDKTPKKIASHFFEWWWNFSYDKLRVIEHTFWFFVFFMIGTTILLPCLQKNTYELKALQDAAEADPDIYKLSWKKAGKRLWFGFAYAAVIFLMLSIKIENLKLAATPKSIAGTAFVVVMHIAGLVCIAYIAHIILLR